MHDGLTIRENYYGVYWPQAKGGVQARLKSLRVPNMLSVTIELVWHFLNRYLTEVCSYKTGYNPWLSGFVYTPKTWVQFPDERILSN